MQLYTGLPIITNKITVEEQQGISHHLLGCIGLREQTWVVGMFVKKALSVIDEIRCRGKVPILVGGTHYYLQSLLFKDKLADGEAQDQKPFVENMKEQWPILREDTAVLLEELRKVDPVMAERWHPNDRRKIQRSLEIYLQTGRRASDIYAEQRQHKADNILRDEENVSLLDGPSLRFPTLLFWIHADSEVLNERLEKRVDKMLEAGLLDEVRMLNAFAATEHANERPFDETKGIWVSIGYKEFKSYIQALWNEEKSEQELARLKAEGLEKTKSATRQYAKRQIRWVRIKLVNALQEADASENLYLLDGSDVSAFDERVVESALDLTHSFLSTTSPLPNPTSLSDAAAEMLTPKRDFDLSAQPERWVKNHCDVCGTTCVTEEQWRLHVKSKTHRKSVSKRAKAEESRNSAEVPPD